MSDQNLPAVNREFSIGIDFGTTKSALAYTRLKDYPPQPFIGTSQVGLEFIPTVAYVTEDHRKLIGEIAEDFWRTRASEKGFSQKQNNERLLQDFKLHLGNTEYRHFLHKFGLMGAYELAALVIYYLKSVAEAYDLISGGPIKEAVITCPAGWGNDQKELLIKAANIAGIDHPNLIKEPTAALYEIDRYRPLSQEDAKVIVVLDYGGGTCDVTVCRTIPGSFLEAREPEILAEQTGNFGGRNVDQAIFNFFVREFHHQQPEVPSDCLASHETFLKQEAKRRKEDFANRVRLFQRERKFLSSIGEMPKYKFEIPRLYGNRSLKIEWDEESFGEIILPEVGKIIDPVIDALEKAGLKRKAVQMVTLVGGSSLLPTIEDHVQRMFGRYPVEIYIPPYPRHAVVFGAAIYHYYEKNPDERGPIEGRKRYATLRIGLDKNRTYVLVEANEKIPTERRIWECKTPQNNMRYIDILVLEGGNEQLQGNETYAWRRFEFGKPVPKGAQIVIEYRIDKQDIFAMYAYLKDNPKINASIVGRQSISPDEIAVSRKRLALPDL